MCGAFGGSGGGVCPAYRVARTYRLRSSDGRTRRSNLWAVSAMRAARAPRVCAVAVRRACGCTHCSCGGGAVSWGTLAGVCV